MLPARRSPSSARPAVNSVSVFESGAGTDVADLTSPGNGSFFGTSTASTLTVGTSTITVNTYFVSSGQTVAVPGQVVVTGARHRYGHDLRRPGQQCPDSQWQYGHADHLAGQPDDQQVRQRDRK